jgi:hypothetical protein
MKPRRSLMLRSRVGVGIGVGIEKAPYRIMTPKSVDPQHFCPKGYPKITDDTDPDADTDADWNRLPIPALSRRAKTP